MLLKSNKIESPLEKQYYDILNPVYLDWDYVKNYIDVKPPFGSLGTVVYLRTYSRFIPELSRREHWWETVLRVVEYSMSLFPKRPRVPYSDQELKREAQDLYDCIFNMNVFPAGRTLFTGGAAIKDGSSQFNCSFVVVDSIKAFTDAFYLLMNGCGVGFSVEKRYIQNLPVFSPHLEVRHLDYNPVPKNQRQEHTTTTTWNAGEATIVIGDSKEGWVHALSYFMHAFISGDAGLNKITLIYDNVRGEGEKLRTFGGRASGPRPLRKAFEKIEAIIKGASNGVLSSVDAMDIMNTIAEAVVVGGVRRSSQIAFGDVDDVSFIEAKLDLWTDPNKADKRNTRVLSNNSVTLWEKPSKSVLIEIFERIKNNGEPGISIAGNAAKRRPNYRGSNPCHK